MYLGRGRSRPAPTNDKLLYHIVLKSEIFCESCAQLTISLVLCYHRRHQEFLRTIIFSSNVLYPSMRLDAVKEDPADNKILECAVEASASFAVTGDRGLCSLA